VITESRKGLQKNQLDPSNSEDFSTTRS
jgi:hypothetical protein